MKCFTFSTIYLSAASMLLVAGAIAPSAQAFPKADPNFKIQTLRLSELDARGKGEYDSQPYYPQSPAQVSPQPASPQSVTVEQNSTPTTEPTDQETSETPEEKESPTLSVTERRQQSLDRS